MTDLTDEEMIAAVLARAEARFTEDVLKADEANRRAERLMNWSAFLAALGVALLLTALAVAGRTCGW